MDTLVAAFIGGGSSPRKPFCLANNIADIVEQHAVSGNSTTLDSGSRQQKQEQVGFYL